MTGTDPAYPRPPTDAKPGADADLVRRLRIMAAVAIPVLAAALLMKPVPVAYLLGMVVAGMVMALIGGVGGAGAGRLRGCAALLVFFLAIDVIEDATLASDPRMLDPEFWAGLAVAGLGAGLTLGFLLWLQAQQKRP